MSADVAVTGGGTVFIVRPLTDEARTWIEDNVPNEGYHPEYPTLVVEHRYIGDLVAGMRDDGGLVVKGDE